MTTKVENNKIHNEVVFGGNNVVCCMLRNRTRCFGGHKPTRLVFAFFLINIPGVIFNLMLLHKVFGPTHYQTVLIISVML